MVLYEDCSDRRAVLLCPTNLEECGCCCYNCINSFIVFTMAEYFRFIVLNFLRFQAFAAIFLYYIKVQKYCYYINNIIRPL